MFSKYAYIYICGDDVIIEFVYPFTCWWFSPMININVDV